MDESIPFHVSRSSPAGKECRQIHRDAIDDKMDLNTRRNGLVTCESGKAGLEGEGLDWTSVTAGFNVNERDGINGM